MPKLPYPRKILIPALLGITFFTVAAGSSGERDFSASTVDTTNAPPSSAWLGQLPDGPEKEIRW